MTYASTIILGLLALWQNQRFKEENDKSQERLEKISNRTNELLKFIKKVLADDVYFKVTKML